MFDIYLRNPNDSVMGDWRYILEVDYPDSVFGLLPVVSDSGVQNLFIHDSITNLTGNVQEVTYTFTPYIDPSDDGADCGGGVPMEITVWVDPSPAIRVVANDTVICNETTTLIEIENPHGSSLGEWKYNLWVVADSPLLTGWYGSSGEDTTEIVNDRFEEFLTNDDTIAHSVTYHFQPISIYDDSVLCKYGDGGDTTITIWVNPTPEIRLEYDQQDLEICTGEEITLYTFTRNPNDSVMGEWLYEYEVEITDDAMVQGISAGITDVTGDINNHPYTLTNLDTRAHQVTFHLRPRIIQNDHIGEDCGGIDTSIVVTIYPEPLVVPDIPDTLICDGDWANIDIINPNTRLYNGQWWYYLEVIEPSGNIDGESASDSITPTGQNPDPINDELINNDINYHEVIYRFVPHIRPTDGDLPCAGDTVTITVWVNPTPELDISLPDTIFCNNTAIDIDVIDLLGPDVFGSKKYQVGIDYDYPSVEVYNTRDGLLRPDNSLVLDDVGVRVMDSLVNNLATHKPVKYGFWPYIYDTRPGKEGQRLCSGEDTIRIIQVNPTPEISVTLIDSILCHGETAFLSTSPEVNPYVFNVVFGLDVDYDSDSVTGSVTPNGVYNWFYSIEDWLFNDSDTVQVLDYEFTAMLKDNREGQPPDKFCYDGNVVPKRVLLNPYPELRYMFAEGRDTLCYLETFELTTDPTVYATHDLYYTLSVANPDGISGVNENPADSTLAGIALDGDGDSWVNESLDLGIVRYEIRPFISEEGCLGDIETTDILLNPNPVMEAARSDWAVCYSEGFELPMSTEVGTTTGTMQYMLYAYNFDPGNLTGPVPLFEDSTYSSIVNLDQPLRNTGDSIEDVTYRFTPVIYGAREDLGDGAGAHCWGQPLDSIVVEVAPAFRPEPWAVEYIGGWEIRCNSLLSDSVFANLSGGYYRDRYTYAWETTDGNGLVADASDQFALDTGLYRYYVYDEIGCDPTSWWVHIQEPDTITVVTLITPATCRDDGAIMIDPQGGTRGYTYFWDGPGIYTSTKEDNFNLYNGEYLFALTDTNGCVYEDKYVIPSSEGITVTQNESDYHGFEITCPDAADGYIELSVRGGDPPYEVKLFEAGADYQYDTPLQTIPGLGKDILDRFENLPPGNYEVVAYDLNTCQSEVTGSNQSTIEEPDIIAVEKDNERYRDTVDISCYGEMDGEIHLALSGGRTHMYPNQFLWTGPGIVQGDSTQRNLGPGSYTVLVTDIENCTGNGAFELYEPPQLLMQVDSMYYTTDSLWNITCYGLTDGFISTGASGGIPGYHYEWSTSAMGLINDTLQTQGGLVAGRYDLRITDSIGCVLDTAFVLRQPNPVDLDTAIIPMDVLGVNAIFCNGDSSGAITIIPAGGADSLRNVYQWSTTDGTGLDVNNQNQVGLTVGTYKLVVTDINGCDSSWSFTLTEPTAMVVDALSSDSADCAGTATAGIELEVSGGVPDYTYLWVNDSMTVSAFTQDLDSIYAGFYTVSIRDLNNCELVDTITVYEADNFGVLLEIASNYHGVPVSCFGYSDGAIDLEPLGGTGPYYFRWSNGETSEDLEGLPAGEYSVQLWDSKGCRDSAEVVLTEPTAVAYSYKQEDPLCYNDSNGSIELLITGGTVNALDDYRVWLNGDLAGPVMENLPQGEYYVRIEDLNDCFAGLETELIHPDTLMLDFDTRPAYCPDTPDGGMDLYISGGNGGYRIFWDQGLPGDETYFNDIYSGEYVATVTDIKGCVVVDTALVEFEH